MTTSLQPLIGSRIVVLRKQRVMLDADLAQLYGVETRTLVQGMKRNQARFPADFMFQLTAAEFSDLRSQDVISSAAHGGRRTPPYAFTEQGVAMLSSVLGSARAIAVNIALSRETKAQLRQIFDALRALMTPPDPPRRPIGFHTPATDKPTPRSRTRA